MLRRVTTRGDGMTETGETAVGTDGSDTAFHDHAWRRVSSDQGSPGRLGVYRCDLCSAGWSMQLTPRRAGRR